MATVNFTLLEKSRLLFRNVQIHCAEFHQRLHSGAADDAEKQRGGGALGSASGHVSSDAWPFFRYNLTRQPSSAFPRKAKGPSSRSEPPREIDGGCRWNVIMPTDAELISSMVTSGKPGAFSVPLQEPAKFATIGAQVNHEMTEMAKRGTRPSAQGSQLKGLAESEKTITKERVLEEVRRADLRPLWIGRYAYLWSSTQPDRSEALRELKGDLVRDDFISVAARLDQYIVVYFVAWLLGWDEAQLLRLEAMKAMRRLVAQNKATGEYQLRRQCERPARALWRQMVASRMTGAAVRAAVEKILPSKSNPKLHGRAGAAAKFLKQLKTWKWESQDQVLQALAILQEKLNAMRPADSQVA